MAKYNRTFELSIEDIDRIEGALRARKRDVSEKSQDEARQIHELLGRLHNQKIFYRPAKGVYVGG